MSKSFFESLKMRLVQLIHIKIILKFLLLIFAFMFDKNDELLELLD